MKKFSFPFFVTTALLAGSLIALIFCVLFGVLDIQCRNNKKGPYWNARTASCQATEVDKISLQVYKHP